MKLYQLSLLVLIASFLTKSTATVIPTPDVIDFSDEEVTTSVDYGNVSDGGDYDNEENGIENDYESAARKKWEKKFPGTSYKWRSKCKNSQVWHRREWRTLSSREQKKYTDAVRCLFTKSSLTRANAPGSRHRFDDFCAVHIRQTDNIHFVGHFLPWHRLMMSVYEEYLHAECGYDSGIPYWDWTLDSGIDKLPQSPIFYPTAFGGNGDFIPVDPNNVTNGVYWDGRTGGGCINDGPFTGLKINVGPGNSTAYNPHCISRDLVPRLSQVLTKEMVNRTLSEPDFYRFDFTLQGENLFRSGFDLNEFGVHGAGHYVIGGTLGSMGSQYSSCSDPTFYLHHAQIDRLWWLWQQQNPSVRLSEIGGPIDPVPLFGPVPIPTRNVTLGFPIDLAELTSPWNITVGDMMNTVAGPLCYDYI
ncbi:hypothetical protein HK098_003321 [Nowakowskiella sp. JEL0407]|nr:hypothetical protein HK098_003321 [Nowakowskiella sp. JEL0407]